MNPLYCVEAELHSHVPLLFARCAAEERDSCCHFTPDKTPHYFNAGFYVMTPRCGGSSAVALCLVHPCLPLAQGPPCIPPAPP